MKSSVSVRLFLAFSFISPSLVSFFGITVAACFRFRNIKCLSGVLHTLCRKYVYISEACNSSYKEAYYHDEIRSELLIGKHSQKETYDNRNQHVYAKLGDKCQHSEGISSLASLIHSSLGQTPVIHHKNPPQKTAWFMLHKIRGLFGQSDSVSLGGEVEIDEMYLGGRETNKHESKKTEGTQGRSTKTKTPIFGMLERDGKVVAMKVEDTKGATLMPIVSQFVEEGSTTYTDEASIYGKLDENGFNHVFVNHGKREFVRCKDIHTNGIEGFWAHFKRVVFSTYHCVSKDYLQRYIDEQTYRWNTRKMDASYRFEDMFKKAVKSFKYYDVIALSSVIDVNVWRMKHDSYYWMKKVA